MHRFVGLGRSLRLCPNLVGLLLLASPAFAQPQAPVSGVIVDVRGAFPFYPDDAAIATPRGTTSEGLPSKGLGVEIGAHVYPVRWKVVTFGFGASALLSRGSRTPEVPEGSTEPPGPTVQARLTALTPQVSLNFGHRQGWSYLSGGLGRATYRAWREDLASEDGAGTSTLNYGGGARWFVRTHLALSLDLRFYKMSSRAASDKTAGHPAMTVVVASAGVSFR